MRRAALLLVLILATLLGAAPAVAGGPTSVLVTVPGEGRSTSLYHTDTAYDRLWDAVGVGQDVEPADDPGGAPDRTPVTLTWLIHDVAVWRVDQVFVHDGTAYVRTQENLGGGPLSEGTSVLHEAAPELMPLLDRLLPDDNGYLKETRVDSAPAPEPAGEPAAEAATGAEAVQAPSPMLVAAAGLVGLVVGLVVGVLGTRTALAVRRRREEEDQERFVCGATA
jgi:hypothetical protein